MWCRDALSGHVAEGVSGLTQQIRPALPILRVPQTIFQRLLYTFKASCLGGSSEGGVGGASVVGESPGCGRGPRGGRGVGVVPLVMAAPGGRCNLSRLSGKLTNNG